MKVYAIMVNKNVEDYEENFILDSAVYRDESSAWKRMLVEAQFVKDGMNTSASERFDLDVYAASRGCSVTSLDSPDSITFTIFELEEK